MEISKLITVNTNKIFRMKDLEQLQIVIDRAMSGLCVKIANLMAQHPIATNKDAQPGKTNPDTVGALNANLNTFLYNTAMIFRAATPTLHTCVKILVF
ncbi:1051_t:CDS:2 [Ambispora leptoticha]|uniref:1051_t:CDS:1 n=1 Tax=Ambispora leptoticha TaxID=144679 RepID=A0A9N9B5M5_9GLOM|nr:1051_t:CDS:2 [Ambispora leptoticha]